MKAFLQTLVLASICVCAQAQTFTRKADFPGPSRWNTYSFMPGSMLYPGSVELQ